MPILNTNNAASNYYSDLDLDFFAHPITKDIVPLKGDDAIKRSVYNLIMTNFGDRKFRPWIGGSVRSMLFENIVSLTANSLIDAIAEVIQNYEPRVSLEQVTVKAEDNNTLTVTIIYTINATSVRKTIDVILKRHR